jgi:hypothetical protein
MRFETQNFGNYADPSALCYRRRCRGSQTSAVEQPWVTAALESARGETARAQYVLAQKILTEQLVDPARGREQHPRDEQEGDRGARHVRVHT